MKIKIKIEKVIEVDDWDELVSQTYGRPYSFQQQDGAKDRGVERISVPVKTPFDYEKDKIVEKCDGPDEGVSFKAWLERDPKQPLENQQDDFELDTWWDRNFYPSVDMVINDLHAKGLLEEGDYVINIDW